MEKVFVLNADYTPLNVTSIFKGFNLVNRGKAEVLKTNNINSALMHKDENIKRAFKACIDEENDRDLKRAAYEYEREQKRDFVNQLEEKMRQGKITDEDIYLYSQAGGSQF